MREISDFLQKNSNNCINVHIIGDSMVDEYYKVKVTRISPELPNVAVMKSDFDDPTSLLPGGAGNVCYQLKNFNAESQLFCFIDEQSKAIYRSCGINTENFIDLPSYCKISRKKRFFDNEFQVGNRWDVERKNYGLGDDLLSFQVQLINKVKEKNKEPDVVILSDYNKGLFEHIRIFDDINFKCPTIVDPKKGPVEYWRGCTIFKPNSEEALALSGESDWRLQCDYFMKEVECQAVVITQRGNGVVGKNGENYFEYYPINKVNTNRISGAGDCFIGILALAVGHGFSIEEASIIAFEAGALFVQQTSLKPITPWQMQKKSKFATIQDLRNRDYKLALSNGCYDVAPHGGHLETLRFAKSKADKLVVAVNSDASVKRLKGPERPIVPLVERMNVLAALEFVDFVISFDEDSPERLISEIMPDVLVKGADWQNKPVAGSNYVKEIYFVPLVKDKSTTNIIEKIKNLG